MTFWCFALDIFCFGVLLGRFCSSSVYFLRLSVFFRSHFVLEKLRESAWIVPDSTPGKGRVAGSFCLPESTTSKTFQAPFQKSSRIRSSEDEEMLRLKDDRGSWRTQATCSGGWGLVVVWGECSWWLKTILVKLLCGCK